MNSKSCCSGSVALECRAEACVCFSLALVWERWVSSQPSPDVASFRRNFRFGMSWYSRNKGSVAIIRAHSLLTNSSRAKLAPERLRKAEVTTLESIMSLSMSHHRISHRMFEVGSPDSSGESHLEFP